MILSQGVPLVIVVLIAANFFQRVHSFCPRNSYSYEDKCYSFKTYYRTFRLSEADCFVTFGKLASITSQGLLQFLSEIRRAKMWVGLRQEKNKQLEWFDQTPAENQPWVVTDSGQNSSDCFALSFGEIQRENCDTHHQYICERGKDMYDPIENCMTGLTEHSFIGSQTGNCIYRLPVTMKQNEVEAKCEETGGRFSDFDDVFKDGVDSFNEHKVMLNDGYRYWTNVIVNGTQLHKKSFDVFTTTLTIFSIEQGSGDCVTVSFKFGRTGVETHMHITECDDQAHVICNQPPFPTTFISEHERRSLPTTVITPQEQQILSCPKGFNWKVYQPTGQCYWETSFETSRLSWDEARAYCQAYGGDLTSFHSLDEEKIGLSFQYGSLAHPYWIGLTLDLETETYKWSDGSPLDYVNWAPGHPNHRDKRLRCVSMDAAKKQWVSSLCWIVSWFVCKAPKTLNPTTPTLPERKALDLCERTSVAEKQYFYEGFCYNVVNVPSTWHRAKQFCENEGSSLASINSDQEIGFLLRLLYEDKNTRGNRVWIGLNSLAGLFRWTDWTPVVMTYWNEGEPNDAFNQEKCCNMYIGNGLWNDENCNIEMGFICKQVKNATVEIEIPVTRDPSIGYCKKGWYAYRDRCYIPVGIIEKDRANWTTASDICLKLGGYLVSIRNKNEQAYLTFLMQSLKEDTWIGLHDTILSGRYYWVDNSDIQYTNWGPLEPSVYGIQEDCVHLDSKDLPGSWKDDTCDRKLPFICHAAKDPDTPQPVYNRDLTCLHPEGWLKLDSMCFRMFAGSPKTWSEAESICQKEGGHLISVESRQVEVVAAYLASEANTSFWIGLQYKPSIQKFEWLNKWPMSFSAWGKNGPPRPEDRTCFTSSQKGHWVETSCAQEMPYICQISSGKPPFLKRYGGNCPKTSDAWREAEGSYCYMGHKSISDWYTATLSCFQYGTFLASFHSSSDLEQVKSVVCESLGCNVRSIFIGLIRNAKAGFTWSDRSPVDFVNWDLNEPEVSDDNCVEMLIDTLKWRVAPCTQLRHFVCATHKELEIKDLPDSQELSQEADEGLSPAAIFGILLGCVSIIAGVVYLLRPSLGRGRLRLPFSKDGLSFDNALYNAQSATMDFQQEDDTDTQA